MQRLQLTLPVLLVLMVLGLAAVVQSQVAADRIADYTLQAPPEATSEMTPEATAGAMSTAEPLVCGCVRMMQGDDDGNRCQDDPANLIWLHNDEVALCIVRH